MNAGFPLVIRPLKLDNGGTVLTEGNSWRGEKGIKNGIGDPNVEESRS
jgi:hypothetical protein